MAAQAVAGAVFSSDGDLVDVAYVGNALDGHPDRTGRRGHGTAV